MSQLWLFRLVGIGIVMLSLGAVYKYIQHTGETRCENKQDVASAKLILDYQERLTKAEAERDANQTTIDRLNADARRVRVHFPACPAVAGGKDQNISGGVLSNRVDESFAKFQARGTELFTECERLNGDAIKANHAQK